MKLNYDIIVVGAGHAGCEAAAATANLGSKTLLITMDMTKVAQMSCNPAIGGIAKGQIVREIDALGGYIAIITDKTSIQFRMLNLSKGPAMWSPRSQCDRMLYSIEWRKALESINNLDLWQDIVIELIISNNQIRGLKTQNGITFYAKSIILTNGTFLNGLMHIGKSQIIGGRISEPSSIGISEQLSKFGFEVGRMKTGTPARLDGRSIDFSKLEEQKGDTKGKFSFLNFDYKKPKQRSCYITYTDNSVHDILRLGFKDSPLFNGIIQGIGPRYCPSIEDKIETFYDKDSHQLFLEPEGEDTVEYYINGFSSSLPWEIQYKALRKIKGLENVKIFRPGYAIEYDYFPPTQLKYTLETKIIDNLYFAGQINGTTGYEEAAAQGLMAAINAHHKINSKNEIILNRNQAYIGVLIDDLITKGVDEPYRMFTSRAEYRILLRQDNADSRLTPIAQTIGLAKKSRIDRYLLKQDSINEIIEFCKLYSVKPEFVNSYLTEAGSSELKQKTKLYNLILRPGISLHKFVNIIPKFKTLVNTINTDVEEVIDAAEINIKYSGYIQRESLIADKIKRLEHIKINGDIDYNSFPSITIEARQKLNRIKPNTIGQASRISGVSPADINVLLVYFGR